MPASELDLSKVCPDFPEFTRYGIPLELVSAELLVVLQRLRGLSGAPIIPSPDPRGWARLDGPATSRHYAVGRLSDAGDVFPARSWLREVWACAMDIREVGGLGVYACTRGPDGASWPMLHLDLRPRYGEPRVLWARDVRGAYWYRSSSPREFWRVFSMLE